MDSKLFERMVDLVEKADGAHWMKGYKSLVNSVRGNGDSPRNFISHKNYNGVNSFYLGMVSMLEGYDSDEWLTFDQMRKEGGKFIKDAKGKGEPVVFCKPNYYQPKDENGIPMVDKDGNPLKKLGFTYRGYIVYNVSLTNLEYKPMIPDEKDKIKPLKLDDISKCNADMLARLEKYKSNGLPRINYTVGINCPCYRPVSDSFEMPSFDCFNDESAFWHTFYHEIAHSTGAKGRLEREGVMKFDRFGSDRYAKEELVAEMSANLCMVDAPFIDTWMENSAEYLKNWLNSIKHAKNKNNILYNAFSSATKVYEYVVMNGYRKEIAV